MPPPITAPKRNFVNDLLQALLAIMGFIVALTGIILAIILVNAAKDRMSISNPAMLAQCVTYFVGSGVVTLILLALAKLLQWHGAQARLQQDQILALATLNNTLAQLEGALMSSATASTARADAAAVAAYAEPTSPPPAPEAPVAVAGGPSAAATEQLINLLSQIRDLTLMPEAQRLQVSERYWEHQRQQHQKLIEHYVNAGDWNGAHYQIEALRKVLPEDPLTDRMTAYVNAERAARAKHDIDAHSTQIRHFMSITAWSQAEELLGRLRQRYPGEPAVDALAADVQRERDTFEKENFARLLMELRDATDHREWRRAYLAAQELVRRYPNDRKIEKLRNEQLETLRENAEAQERKEEESLFKDLLQRQRYEDAASVAHRIVDKYPNSVTAVELNKLLPKVEELIRQEKLKRQATEATKE